MALKFKEIPTSKNHLEEIADFWEIETIKHPGQFVSKRQILKSMSHGSDELDHRGIESVDDRILDRLDDAFSELCRRVTSTSFKYPFDFSQSGIRLKEEGVEKDIYLFLLLATRFNMRNDKIQNDIDGTKIFERLSAEIAKVYFGERSKSCVFGTATGGNFESKVKNLVRKIGDGGGFKNPYNNPVTKNDDGVDVVVWIDFADGETGKLLAFGQCKTGTSWNQSVSALSIHNFCQTWFQKPPLPHGFVPLPMLFLCDTLQRELNREENFMTG